MIQEPATPAAGAHPAPASGVALFDCCQHCEHTESEMPDNRHPNPCPEGCNDD